MDLFVVSLHSADLPEETMPYNLPNTMNGPPESPGHAELVKFFLNNAQNFRSKWSKSGSSFHSFMHSYFGKISRSSFFKTGLGSYGLN